MFAWQATVQDDDGNAVPLPVVTVWEADGVTLADIFDEAGVALPNPLTGTLDGFVQFWADTGEYVVEGASGGGLTEPWAVSIKEPRFDNVSALLADTSLRASSGTVVTTREEGFSYIVMPAGTALGPSGYHVATAGGVLLAALPVAGELAIEALAPLVDANNAARIAFGLITAGLVDHLTFAGLYGVSETFEVHNAFARVSGSGRSGLLFTGVDGILWDNSGVTIVRGPVVFDGVEILSASDGVYTGVKFIGKIGVGYNLQFRMHDCHVDGHRPTMGYWHTCVELETASQSLITGCHIGGHGLTTRQATYGVKTNMGNGIAISENTQLTNCETAVWVNSTGSVMVQACMVVGVKNGVVRTGGENHLDVSNCHFACDVVAVRVEGGNHCQINSNFLLTQSDMSTDDFIGFDIQTSFNTLIGNEVLKTGVTKNARSVRLTGTANDNLVIDLRSNAVNVGVEIASGAQRNAVLDCVGVGVSDENLLVNAGTSTRYRYSNTARAAVYSPSNEFFTWDGLAFRVQHLAPGTPAAAYITAFSHVAGGIPRIQAEGAADNVSFATRSKGTGSNIMQSGDGTSKVSVNNTGVGFFGVAPVAKPTGVAVTAAGIHAALVSLGLIGA